MQGPTTMQRPHLMIMGSRGPTALKRPVLGSVSTYLVHHANCSLCVVPLAKEARDADAAQRTAAF